MFENGGRFQLDSNLTPLSQKGTATFTSLSGVLSVNDVGDREVGTLEEHPDFEASPAWHRYRRMEKVKHQEIL